MDKRWEQHLNSFPSAQNLLTFLSKAMLIWKSYLLEESPSEIAEAILYYRLFWCDLSWRGPANGADRRQVAKQLVSSCDDAVMRRILRDERNEILHIQALSVCQKQYKIENLRKYERTKGPQLLTRTS